MLQISKVIFICSVGFKLNPKIKELRALLAEPARARERFYFLFWFLRQQWQYPDEMSLDL